ncbi:hypothetical protein Ahy_B07g086758 [Arachis hypogaea]|uniref:Aminotransferase-like plant mobile domain-containing protein n=1 Tax=Arachis hypogaea TaxID=3818 RepID=A0A444YAG0_ARAHY|nr:hypothetical protein Ahy_B07g086758 [Arachis hypogaea]
MAGSSSQIPSSDKGKGHTSTPPPPPALRILNQIDDEIIDDPHIQSSDNRILIPFTIGTDTHCFLGPIESLEKVNKKSLSFPSVEGEDLLINQSFNISHFINQKMFRNNPKINPRGYDFTAWYRRLEPTKSAMSSLPTTWVEKVSESPIMNIVQMSKLYLSLAILLHEGKILNLAKLPLGHIFEELGQFVCDLRDNKLISAGGPLWLLQLWLNAIFENFMTKPESGHTDKQYIEGFRLSAYKPNFPNAPSDEDKFWAVFTLFPSCKNFENEQLNFTPFLCRNRGPAWLDRLLFPKSYEGSELAKRSWAHLLAKKEKFKIALNAPHLSARQLEFSQAIPKPQPRNDDPFCHFLLTTQEDFDSCLAMNQQRRDHFSFMEYERSSYITKSCVEWWAAYYARYTHTLEDIQQTAIQTAPIAESSPKRTQKRKAETARPPLAKSRKTPTKTSRKLILLSSTESSKEIEPANKDTPAVSSQSEDVADSDSSPQLIRRTKTSQPAHVTHSVTSAEKLNPLILPQQHGQEQSTSHNSIQFSGPRVIPATFPLSSHTTQIVDLTTNTLQYSPAETQRIESTSSDHQVSETPPELQLTPSDLAQLQTPPRPKPSTSIILTTPSSATLDDLTSILNKIIQGTKVPIPIPVIPSPVYTRPPIELDLDTREQLRSLIKLLDHPPASWVNDPILNQLLTSLLSSSFKLPTNIPNFDLIQGFKQLIEESVAFHFQFQEIKNREATTVSKIKNYQATAQSIKAARDEFDLKIARAISVQAFHDQEEARLEAELALIQEQLTTLRQNWTTLARPLVAAQQEQHLLIQQLVSIDTEREKVEQQLEEIQTDKSKQIGMLTTLENKRTKLRSILAKLLAP